MPPTVGRADHVIALPVTVGDGLCVVSTDSPSAVSGQAVPVAARMHPATVVRW
jgi:hypothetical protein